MEHEQKLKLVTEYDGWELICVKGQYIDVWKFVKGDIEDTGGDSSCYDKNSTLPYYTDWNLQISVWSKASNDADSLWIKSRSDEWHQRKNISVQYQMAVESNNPQQGFETLVELILFIQKHKQPTNG